MPTLSEVGEYAFIEKVRCRLPPGVNVIVGIGDDAAVVRPDPQGEDLLLTSDAVLTGRHFDNSSRPESIGHKAIARALSDLAAMGGKPRWALVNLVAPRSESLVRMENVYAGAAGVAARHGLALVGGDTTEGESLELHVFAVGSLPQGSAVLRSGAHAGDAILVTGALGGSRQGRHLTFEPRVAEGQWLRSWASSMIDVSDGLATDVQHLARSSGIGAVLDAASIPIHMAASQGNDTAAALMHALTDGEDYELLFTVAPGRVESMLADWSRHWPIPCAHIGNMRANAGPVMIRKADGCEEPAPAAGFEHFSSPQPTS